VQFPVHRPQEGIDAAPGAVDQEQAASGVLGGQLLPSRIEQDATVSFEASLAVVVHEADPGETPQGGQRTLLYRLARIPQDEDVVRRGEDVVRSQRA
jgi:hypothetical protein